MNTQYSQYVNEARAAQHQQDLQREAAADRALQAQHTADEQVLTERPSYRFSLVRVLVALVRRQPRAVPR